MKLATYTLTGKKTADTDISLFDNPAKPEIVAQAVRVYLSNQRGGNAKTKSRGEVLYTKKKVYRQKGTGNARHGARSAPIFVGGGAAHGPRGNANWTLSMSKIMRKRALETALALQAAEGNVVIVDGFDKVSGKTSEIAKFLKAMQVEDKAVLFVVAKTDETLMRATNNLRNVFVCPADTLTTYYVARAQKVVLTPDVVEQFQTKFTNKQVDADTKPMKTESKKKSVRAEKKGEEKKG